MIVRISGSSDGTSGEIDKTTGAAMMAVAGVLVIDGDRTKAMIMNKIRQRIELAIMISLAVVWLVVMVVLVVSGMNCMPD